MFPDPDDSSTLYAFYTSMEEDNGKEEQSLAISHDGGDTFVEYAGNPLIDVSSKSFRDPKVIYWKDTFVMTVARPDKSKIEFYTTKDPKQWSAKPSGEFLMKNSTKGAWEHPDLFEMPIANSANATAWVLLVSVRGVGV